MPTQVDSVCGNDGVSYPSDCDMRVKACEDEIPIISVRKGNCPGRLNIFCTIQV